MRELTLRTLPILTLTFLIAACTTQGTKGGEEKASEAMEETAAVPELPTYNLSEDMAVSFENLEDGDIVNSPFTIAMGVTGMEVEPAGAYTENKGHHHLVINGDFVTQYEIVPADEFNIHYGDGRTETEVELAPGDYSLTLQFADGYHRSYGKQLSATISVTVL